MLSDIKKKLNLPENCDAELIVAKAIRDGTLRAVIDHENQYITIKVWKYKHFYLFQIKIGIK